MRSTKTSARWFVERRRLAGRVSSDPQVHDVGLLRQRHLDRRSQLRARGLHAGAAQRLVERTGQLERVHQGLEAVVARLVRLAAAHAEHGLAIAHDQRGRALPAVLDQAQGRDQAHDSRQQQQQRQQAPAQQDSTHEPAWQQALGKRRGFLAPVVQQGEQGGIGRPSASPRPGAFAGARAGKAQDAPASRRDCTGSRRKADSVVFTALLRSVANGDRRQRCARVELQRSRSLYAVRAHRRAALVDRVRDRLPTKSVDDARHAARRQV